MLEKPWIRRWLVLVVIALLLAGCSRDTLLTVRADLLSFIGESELTGELTAVDGTFYIPDEDGFSAGEFSGADGALGALEALSAQIEVALESESLTGSVDISLDFHLATGDEDLFATPPLVTGSATLSPGENGSLRAELTVDESVNSGVLDEIKESDFRVGAKLEVSGLAGGTVRYTVEEAFLSATTRPGELLPF